MNKYEILLNDEVTCMLFDDEKKLLQELVERATPKKVKNYHDCTKQCPSCHAILSQDLQYGGRHHTISKFCPECGQALERSE